MNSTASTEIQSHAHGLDARLPAELVVDIFRLLDSPGRLAVSHVCASWRRAALLDPLLWSAYTVQRVGSLELRGHKATGALTALMERSRPLPFRLYCKDEVPNAVMELVFANIQRIGVLHLDEMETEDLRRLQDIEAPLLTDFACRWATPPDGVPWAVPSRWALRIQHLDLRFPCQWPSGCIFSALRSLSGIMPGGHGFGRQIASYFPSLQSLRLVNLTPESLSDLISLPRSLAVLSLGTSAEGVDSAELLRSWRLPCLRELSIHGVCTTRSAFEVIRLFARTEVGPWGMHADGCSMMLWAEPTYHFDITCTVPGWLAREPGIPSCWNRLHELHLSLRDFLQFRTSVTTPGLVLPALARASFEIDDEDQFNHASVIDGAPINTPALRSIELLPSPEFKHLSDAVGIVLRTFQAPVPMATLVVRASLPESFGREGLSALRNVVDRVEVRSLTNTIYSSFDMRDER